MVLPLYLVFGGDIRRLSIMQAKIPPSATSEPRRSCGRDHAFKKTSALDSFTVIKFMFYALEKFVPKVPLCLYAPGPGAL